MPNWVTIKTTVNGPEDALAAFRAKHLVPDREGKPYLDFNTVIPMPACLVGSEESTRADMAMQLVEWAAGDPEPFADRGVSLSRQYAGIRQEMEMADAPIKEVATRYLIRHPDLELKALARRTAIEETGYRSWYDWAPKHWGTKWNACDFNLLSDVPLTFRFDTAWSFPEPIFSRLTEMYPGLTFVIAATEEGEFFVALGALGPNLAEADQFTLFDYDERVSAIVRSDEPITL